MIGRLALLATLIFTPVLQAQEQRPVDSDSQIDPETYRCAQLLDMERAEDGRYQVRIVWAHGYFSALVGIGASSDPITSEAIMAFAQRLDEACEIEPRMLFVDAIKKLVKVDEAARAAAPATQASSDDSDEP